MKVKIILISIFILAVSVRLFQLDQLPGEWFGDISNVHEYVTEILQGKWPFYFFQSPGPLYHYLIAPLVIIFQNNGYLTYKIASVAVSLLGLVTTYILYRSVFSSSIAMTGILLMGSSFWFLVWSRLGNSQIVIPVISGLMGYFLVKFIRQANLVNLLLGVLAASLGLYTYPQTFIFPLIWLAVLTGYYLMRRKWRQGALNFSISFILLLVFGLPFFQIVMVQKDLFTSGYLGEKVVPVFRTNPLDTGQKFLTFYGKTLMLFSFSGERIFRVNIPGKAMLDGITSIFLLAGILYLILEKRRKVLFIILFMIGSMIIPASSPGINEIEIPSSSRTIAVIPYLYMLAASGIFYFYNIFKKKAGNISAILAIASLVMMIVYFNLDRYFREYPQVLPDKNYAAGIIIADYMDRNFGENFSVYFGSCCWGEWGQPEPKAVYYQMRKKKNFVEYTHYLSSCKEINHLPAVVVVGPGDQKLLAEYRRCFLQAEIVEVDGKKGNTVFNIINIK